MINWIIGTIIFGITVYIIIKQIIHLRKGECPCNCGHCGNNSDCDKENGR